MPSDPCNKESPLKPKTVFSTCPFEEDKAEMKKTKDKGYLSVCGSWLWASRNTKPNMAYASNQAYKVISCPTTSDFDSYTPSTISTITVSEAYGTVPTDATR